MKKFLTVRNISIAILLLIAIISFVVAFKVYVFVFIGQICFAIAFAWVGISLITKYNQAKLNLEMRKQDTYDRLSEKYDQAYIMAVVDEDSMDRNFKKEFLKYKILGIMAIIFAVCFLYVFLTTV